MEHIKIVKIISIVVSLAGLVVMVGWFFDIEILKSILPFWVTMKFSTALSFLLSGLIVYYVTKSIEGESELANLVLPISGLLIFLLMITFLVSAVLGIRTGVEDFFVQEEQNAVKSATPGRPSIGTMLSFILVAIAAILSLYESLSIRKYLFFIGTAITALGLVAIVGYTINVPVLYYTLEGISTAMAFHTAILFLLIGVGFVLLWRSGQVDQKRGEKNE